MADDTEEQLPPGLREAVEAWLAQRGRSFEWGDDPLSLHVGDAHLRLGALAREWVILEADARPAWLDTALRTVLDGALREVVNRVTADFAEAAPRLRPKLWPESALGAAARGEHRIPHRHPRHPGTPRSAQRAARTHPRARPTHKPLRHHLELTPPRAPHPKPAHGQVRPPNAKPTPNSPLHLKIPICAPRQTAPESNRCHLSHKLALG